MTEKLIVKIENEFAQYSPYKLKTRTHSLFYFLLSQIDTLATNIDDVVVSVKDIETHLKNSANTSRKPNQIVHWGNFKEEVQPFIQELKSCTTMLPSKNEVKYKGALLPEPVTIFKKIVPVYNTQGQPSYKFTIDPQMKGFLYDFASYVQFQLNADVRLSNNYAWRLYIALKSRAASQAKYRKYTYFERTISQIRELLAVPSDSYTASYDFKRYVIEKALEDINKNSDVRCWFEPITKGRTLTGIKFHISLSKYNRHQLHLSLKDKKEVFYSYLKKISKLKYDKINAKEFISYFPDEYSVITSQVEKEFNNFEIYTEGGNITPKILQTWKEGHIKNHILDFAREEIKLYEDNK